MAIYKNNNGDQAEIQKQSNGAYLVYVKPALASSWRTAFNTMDVKTARKIARNWLNVRALR